MMPSTPPFSFSIRERRSPRAGRRRAFALVVVLIVISVLALVAVGFLSSMSQERATANAFANKTRAEQSAQAGVDTAMGLLRDYFKAFPDSVTAWDPKQSVIDDGSANGVSDEGTSLYFRAVSTVASDADPNTDSPNFVPGATTDPTTYNNADYIHGNGPNNVDATTGVDNRKIFVLPLVSGAMPKRLESKANSIRESDDTSNPPRKLKANSSATFTNSTNLNVRRSLTDTTGWLGTPQDYISPTGTTLPKPFVVPWVEIRQQDGVAAGGTAPVIGRYAYWVEDESFRANISYAGIGTIDPVSGKDHQRRDNSINYLLNPTDSDLLSLMSSIGLSDAIGKQYAQNIFDLRTTYPGKIFPESRAFAHSDGLSADSVSVNKLQYLTTSQSSGLNLTRHGTQRLNLNAVMSPSGVTPATTIEKTTPTETTKIQYQVDTLVQTMLFHAPNLGQRLFRLVPTNTSGGSTNAAGAIRPAIASGSVTDSRVLNQMAVSHNETSTLVADNYAKQYYYKIAANVRDYIDADAFPTRVLAGGQVSTPVAPTIPFGDSGDNPIWAIGKDNGPFISECATRPRGSISGRTFDMFIDYYIEVWNMSNRDIKGSDLGPHPFIKVGGPTRWKVGQFTWYNAATPNPQTTPPTNPSVTADLISDDGGPSPSDTRPSSTARDFTIDLSKMMQGGAPVPTDNTVIFPAGKMTVITTDSTWSTIISPTTEAANHIIVCPWLSGKSEYKGHFRDDYTLSPTPATGPVDLIYMILETSTGATATLDSETDITIGSDWGYIDCLQGALPLSASPRIQIPTPTGSAPSTTPNPNYPTVFGGVLRGNWYNTSGSPSVLQASTSGDPRTNNEQLSYSNNSSTATDYSRFQSYDNPNGNNSLTPTPSNPTSGIIQTLGLPNYRSNRPNRPENPWPDYLPYYTAVAPMTVTSPTIAELVLTAAKAPSFVANAPLTSIGQLGDVYDPSRQIEGASGAVSSSYVYSRGGGRSLKIGQHDDRWDGDETSASRSWTAWRLADIFGTSDAIQQPGLININGILRDNGVALRAALTGLAFQQNPLGDAALNAANLNIDQLVTELKARLSQTPINSDSSVNTGGTITVGGTQYPLQTGAGPFWERGELSEVRAFGRTPDPVKSGSGSQLTTTVTYPQPQTGTSEPAIFTTGSTPGTNIDPSSQLYPRGRDELFRRLVEMTTTRGNIFTVYAVGQAISQANPTDISTRRVAATQQLKVTFRLVPKNKAVAGASNATDFHPEQDYSKFNPNDTDDMHQRRFAKPDHYDIEVLSVSSSNN